MKTYHQTSRLWSTVTLLLLATLVLGGCGGRTAKPEGPLVVVSWSGYELPEFWEEFAETYPDIEIDFTFISATEESYTKTQSGFQSDVIHPCSSYWQVFVNNGLVQPIDTSRLSNWSGVYESLAERGKFNGEQYFIPWDWGYESVLVRTDLVEEVPDAWADLWDPQYAGHVVVEDSGWINHAIAALALGFDPYGTTPGQEEQIRQKLLDLKPNVLGYWGSATELEQALASGDAWMAAAAWSQSFVALREEGLQVQYIDPEEGRMGFLCGLCINADAKNLDLAYAYIDAMLAPQALANMANMYGYGVSNADAVPLIDPEMADLLDLDDPDVIGRTNFQKSLTTEQIEEYGQMWSEVKAAP